MTLGWLEHLSAHGVVLSRWPITSAGLLVGRDYACDVRLEDPFCASKHLRVESSEQGLSLRDEGSINGVLDLQGSPINLPMKLGIEQVFVLGQSRIRIRDAAYVVAQEERLPASPPNQATHQRRAWLSNPRSLGFAATALIALEFLGLWLDATSEAQLSTFLAPILTINLIALTWIGFWSLLNRLFAGASRFQSHLRVTLITLLSYSVLDVLASHLGFIFLLPSVGLVMAIIAVLMLAALVYRHLAIIGPEALRFKRAVVLGCLLLVGVGSTVIWYEGRDRRGGADIQVELKPPSWRLRPAMKMEDAMVRLDQLKPELEQARTKPLPRDSVLGGVREDDD